MVKFIRESFWKAYFVVFALTSASNLVVILHPRSDVSVYYQTMSAFLKPNWVLQAAAVLATVITVISLWPLFCRALGLPRQAVSVFRVLFVMRIIADVFGHNYEVNFIKSILLNNPPAGWATLASFFLFMLPSYIIHFDYALRPKSSPLLSREKEPNKKA